MTRAEYITALTRALYTLPAADVTDIARDFEEHFAIGLSQGKTEHEISAELGDPVIVAGTYFDRDLEDIGHTMEESAAHAASSAPLQPNTPQTATPQKDLTGARLFVILFNVLVMWWVAITVFSTLFSFWCISLSLFIGGVGAFAAIAATPAEWIPVLVLSGAAAIFMAAATGILNYFLSKWTVLGCKAYIKWNKKIYNEGF